MAFFAGDKTEEAIASKQFDTLTDHVFHVRREDAKFKGVFHLINKVRRRDAKGGDMGVFVCKSDPHHTSFVCARVMRVV